MLVVLVLVEVVVLVVDVVVVLVLVVVIVDVVVDVLELVVVKVLELVLVLVLVDDDVVVVVVHGKPQVCGQSHFHADSHLFPFCTIPHRTSCPGGFVSHMGKVGA